MTKKEQLSKAKKPNSKKLGYVVFMDYCDFINERAEGMCQICHSAPLAEMHHSLFGCYGADKDDRSIVGTCLQCHIDMHKDKKGLKSMDAQTIAEANWKAFQEGLGK